MQFDVKFADSGMSFLGRPSEPGPNGSGLFGFMPSEAVQTFKVEKPTPHKPVLFEYRNPSFNLFKASFHPFKKQNSSENFQLGEIQVIRK